MIGYRAKRYEQKGDSSPAATGKSMIFNKFRNRLSKSRQTLTRGISQVFGGAKLDDEHLDDLEDLLISADIGVATSQRKQDKGVQCCIFAIDNTQRNAGYADRV